MTEEHASEYSTETQPPVKKGYQLKAEGVYRGTIMRHSMGLSANKTPYLELIGRFTERENDALEFVELETPFTKPLKLWLSKAAMDNSKKTLEYYGFQGNSLAALLPNRPDSFTFEGKPIQARCSHGEYKGRPKEDWNIQRANMPVEEKDLLEALLETSKDWNDDWNEDQAAVENFAEAAPF